MARFRPGETIETTRPEITVEGLPIGPHRFQLIVIDTNGNRSAPDEVVVLVRPRITIPIPTFPGLPPTRPILETRPTTPISTPSTPSGPIRRSRRRGPGEPT